MNVTATDATLGAVVTELNLANLTDDLWESIHANFLEYGVLIFPGQHLSEQAQASLLCVSAMRKRCIRNNRVHQSNYRTKKPTAKWLIQKTKGIVF